MRGDRMVEVYGRRFEGDRLWWIGYAEAKPDKAWCEGHLSNLMGSFKSVEWSAVHAAWIIDMNALENKAIESAAVGEEEPAA